jgi:hypothetical protein
MRLSQPDGFHMASDFAAGISCNVRRGPDLPPMDVRPPRTGGIQIEGSNPAPSASPSAFNILR